MTAETTSAATIRDVVSRARDAFDAGHTRPIEWRKHILQRLRGLLKSRESALVTAVTADFARPRFEAWATEIGYTRAELDHARARLSLWTRSRRVPTPFIFQPGMSRVTPEPLGVTCVISPWNYPVQLLLMPMIAAISAGNAVVGKPSELTPRTSSELARLFQDIDDPAVALVQGSALEGTELLKNRFDHILYTGGRDGAKNVLRAAAEHLTPVTLELGGKSPVVVSKNADITMAARRIAWGKFFNAGQTCIAPDYVIVEDAVRDRLITALLENIRSFFGDDPSMSPDFGRIVNDSHFHRLEKLLCSGTIEAGGQTDAGTRFIAPTVLSDIRPTDLIMQDEVFGPILPVLTVNNLDSGINIARSGGKPLALYIFSNSRSECRLLIDRIPSGGVCVNGTLVYVGNPYLPFGGVGESGMGRYHGKFGFDTFSHLRAIHTRTFPFDPPVMYAPYSAARERILRFGFGLPDSRGLTTRIYSRVRPAAHRPRR